MRLALGCNKQHDKDFKIMEESTFDWLMRGAILVGVYTGFWIGYAIARLTHECHCDDECIEEKGEL